MSGPPKTPTHLRLVRGNPSKRPINKNEPQPPKGVPPVPKHFDKQGKYWFKRMAEELDAIGVISQLDARALELLVEAYTEYRHHCETLDREGYTYAVYSDDDADEGKKREIRMIKPHPAAMMKADAWKRLRAMLAEFGMTPSSRSKVSKDKPDDDDLLSQFLNSRD
ncbi:phage terminase small subunit P27 family [Salmonella enterica subsp. houtenae]|uniref:Phage terminase small subunit P27 family n=4 Tax=Enterobacteriaceae TaxID=543 RepID=A0A729G003_SALHO|nr:phage terminase small subunit P27 family [Salmonella enterica]ECH9932349.1 phage terminase small subunit P27 family [Salmonella enterica subsp. houtenae]EKR1447090.1 phage terminase small subunit P27 family [Salmonella enterica subsp. houtenae serovar 48:z4,z32:-]ECZ5452045.1 phage terminase small subunit P27 family [Salmonella enterica subsp. houtenae]EDN2206346.1 phage terminase small subunit P27 family [Salmonella enterica]